LLDVALIYQQDWNLITNGIDAAAASALQRVACGLELQRFFAVRADKYGQQFLGNHRPTILTPSEAAQLENGTPA
jgi:hypothetical protein